MGTGASKSKRSETVKTVYLQTENDNDIQEVMFSSNTSTVDLKELISTTAGVNRWSPLRLISKDGASVCISPGMPTNTRDSPYFVKTAKVEPTETQMFKDVLDRVGEEFSKAFQVTELRSNVEQRMSHLEKMVEKDTMKSVELERCQREIASLKDYFSHHKAQFQAVDRERRVSNVISRNKKNNVVAYPKYILTEETVQHLKTPTFDIWQWEPNEMLYLLEHMYRELGLVEQFQINPVILKRWLMRIQENYRNNPFHNFRHCFCVAQMMYGVIHFCNLREKMTQLDILELMTAAICHDLDHPGYNNTYQINARTELAIRYNDISPLENHHCAVAFSILSNPDANIVANLSSEDFKHLREGVISLILATDMSRHSEIVGSFEAAVTEGFDCSKEDHRRKLKMMLIKCCDISNEVRPTSVSEPWVDCLLEEYFMQSDREKSEGLPVSPFMDRDKVTKPTAQIGFIKFVLIPLFEATTMVLPQLQTMITALRESLDYYEQLKQMEDMLKDKDVQTKKISLLGKIKSPVKSVASQ